jgi:coenzyme F420-reducing hydrogenase delta subunit
MSTAASQNKGKILIMATESCAYPGANSVGQAHSSYPANTYILRVRAPALFPAHFYMDCFRKGIGGIIIMSCGEECPYEGAYHARAFLKEVNDMNALIQELGPPECSQAA